MIERKLFADTFSGNRNAVTLVAKATAPKPNCYICASKPQLVLILKPKPIWTNVSSKFM